MANSKNLFERRRRRNRAKLRKNATERLRLTVHRSSKHIYAQIIDDRAGHTIAAASSLDKDLRDQLKTGADVDAAKAVGALVASRAREAGIQEVYFDRGGYMYRGRVKALADAVREGGLQF